MASWNDIRNAANWHAVYPEFVQDLHDKGIAAVGTISMMYALQDQATSFDLLPVVMRDPYGNMLERESFYVLSTLHPTFWEYMQSVVREYIDVGVDGILIDEMAYGSAWLPDFNDNTVDRFRQYLLDTYDAVEQQEIEQRYGIEDLSTLDYAALVRDSLSPDRTSLSPEDWAELWDQIPLSDEYYTFVRIRNKELAASFVAASRVYALEQHGKVLAFSANLNDLASREALYMVDVLDHVDLEFFYRRRGYFPGGRAIATVRLAQAVGKPASLLTSYGDTRSDSRDLYRTMIAEAYATGAAFTVEAGCHDIEQDIEALASYYRFPQDHRDLFEDTAPVQGRVALLRLWESLISPGDTDYYGLAQMLADLGYQFSTVFGAEDYMVWGEPDIHPTPPYPLELSNLSPYSAVIVPELADLTENHAAILIQYAESGGLLVVFVTPETVDSLEAQRGTDPSIVEMVGYLRAGSTRVGQGKVISIDQTWGRQYATGPVPEQRQLLSDLLVGEGLAAEVQLDDTTYCSAFLHTGPSQIVVHLVNYDYEPNTDQTSPIPSQQIVVEVPREWRQDQVTVQLLTPEGVSTMLPASLDGGTLQTSLPSFGIWAVLRLCSQ